MKAASFSSIAKRVQQARHDVFQKIPFSREQGIKACQEGKGFLWVQRSEQVALRLDGLNIFFLIAAAAFGLAAIFFYFWALSVTGGCLLPLAMFNMAAELWIEKEEQAVRDHEYRVNPYSSSFRPPDNHRP